MPASFTWQDGPTGGTPMSAANFNKFALVGDIGVAGTPTGDALNAAYGPTGKRVTVMGLGDSITANGGNDYSPTTGSSTWFYTGQSWHLWGHLISGARFMHKGNAATPGYTIQQIKTTHLPTVLAAKPMYCTVLAGQNNLGSLSTQDLADLLSIYTQLQAAGITPIPCTNPPTTTSANLFTLNKWITRTARFNGWPLLDLYGAMVVPSTGLYAAGDSSDGIHPSESGAKKAGQALATLMQALIPAQFPLLATSNFGQTSPPNPLFLNDNGGTPPVPTGWSAVTTNAAGNTALATATGIAGRAWTITRPTGTDNFYGQTTPTTLAAGNRLITAMRISSATKSVGGAVEVFLFDSVGNNRFAFTLHEDIPTGSALAWDWLVPSGLPDYAFHYQVRARDADGSSLTLGQFTTDIVTS